MSTTETEGTDTETGIDSVNKNDWMERILERENLELAWAAVKENDGAAGVDRLTISATQAHLKTHWDEVREKLISGNYRPAAVRTVEIPKESGGSRRLGIPTVQDRLIQQATNQILSAAFDPQMSEHSYGFRPKRSAHHAVDAARGYVASGKGWVVDIDLKDFFDQINHDRLMRMLGGKLRDKRVLALIGRYLRAPMRHADGKQERRSKGSPQGGPLSPLLANLYLSPLDRELEHRGIAFVRYADDIALFLGSERAAHRALESVTAWLQRELQLEVNPSKSGIGPSSGSALLGFRIHEMGNVSIAPKALLRLKERVRQLWDARQSLPSEQLRLQWRRYISGWWNYFGYADWQREVKKLSGWIRRHMRKCFWQRWHNRAGRYKALKRLGIKGRALGVAGCRRGAWPMATHVVMNQALSNARLNRHGLTIPWALAGG